MQTSIRNESNTMRRAPQRSHRAPISGAVISPHNPATSGPSMICGVVQPISRDSGAANRLVMVVTSTEKLQAIPKAAAPAMIHP